MKHRIGFGPERAISVFFCFEQNMDSEAGQVYPSPFKYFYFVIHTTQLITTGLNSERISIHKNVDNYINIFDN